MANGNGKGNRGRVIATRLLLLRNYFFKLKSEGKGASWSDIDEYLTKYDCKIDRKTFYRDRKDLEDMFDLTLSFNSISNEWTLDTPIFKEKEFGILINYIKSQSFYSKDEVNALAEKLIALACLDKVKPLSKNFRPERIEKTYNHVKENIKTILEAIKTNHLISFQRIVYSDWEELLSECASSEIDAYGRPLFYDEHEKPLYQYHDSGPWNPLYIGESNGLYYLHMEKRGENGGKTTTVTLNVAEMEHITILPEERFAVERSYIPGGTMPNQSRTIVTVKAKNQYLDTIKLFFEDAEVRLLKDHFTAKVSVEYAIDLIPCLLSCEGNMEIIEPSHVINALESLGFMLLRHYDKSKLWN